MLYNKPEVLLTVPAVSTIQMGGPSKSVTGQDSASGNTFSTPAGYGDDE